MGFESSDWAEYFLAMAVGLYVCIVTVVVNQHMVQILLGNSLHCKIFHFAAKPIPTPYVRKLHNTGSDINITVISKTIYTSARQLCLRKKTELQPETNLIAGGDTWVNSPPFRVALKATWVEMYHQREETLIIRGNYVT